MVNLNVPTLFADQGWQKCFEHFCEHLQSDYALKTHLRILRGFFSGLEIHPKDVSRDEVEAYCSSSSYHGFPSIATSKRRRAAIRAFYNFASTYPIAGKEALFQGVKPAGITKGPRNDRHAVLFAEAEWQQCLEHFLTDLYRRSQSSSTVVSYRRILVHFFTFCAKPPECITRQDVSTFIAQRSEKAWTRNQDGTPAVSTVNGRISAIRSFFDYASCYDVPGQDGQPVPLYQRANPTAGIRHGQPARVYKSLSQQEIKRFFSVIPESLIGLRDRAMFLTYLITTRRRSELAGLLWGDIAYGTITDTDGSSHEGHRFTFRGKGRQAILDSQELPETCFQAIRHYLEADGRWEHIQPHEPIFRSHGPELGGNVRPGEIRPLLAMGIVNRLKTYARLAQIDETKFSLHSLRHTGAFLRKISGEDLFSISHTLRHKSLDMTRRYLEGVSISNPAFCTLSNTGCLTMYSWGFTSRLMRKVVRLGKSLYLRNPFLSAFHHEYSSGSPGQVG